MFEMFFVILTVLVLIISSRHLCSALRNPIDIIVRDYKALTQKHSSYHILRPPTSKGKSQCLDVKESIRRRVMEGGWVVDEFEKAALRFSSCDETAARGGLLGCELPQGAIRDRLLDRLCFTVPLGEVYGPVESEEGWNLILVTKRVGCKKDEGMTQIVKVRVQDGDGWVVKKVGGGDEVLPLSDATGLGLVSVGVLFSGGVLAEVAAQITSNP
mmetsp:Transcript_13179/g.26871  ORF Transcript_13179/g.26871 Transcript_13179/m.26871 type:complete len:214 (+) Transcript_13179:153-794(+)